MMRYSPTARSTSNQHGATAESKRCHSSRYYYDSHQQLREHLLTFLLAYSFAKRLKTRKGLTPDEYICQQWQQQPDRFLHAPHAHNLGLYT